MQALDTAIAYYLCGIMVVLALIIAIGASRHRGTKQSPGQDSLSEGKE